MKLGTTEMIIVLLTVTFILYWCFVFREVTYVTSDKDNRKYMIRNRYNDKMLKESANILSDINDRIERLLKAIVSKYEFHPRWGRIVSRLQSDYHPGVISEGAKDSRYTTFTIDKKEMHICLRTRDKQQKAYDMNTLMYVVIHELAHMANYDKNGFPIIGHGTEFVEIFKFLLKEAAMVKVYSYQDYSVNPEEYCGINIDSNVLSQNDVM